ncbi:MAG: cold shock domain-containing protein [Candidatus Omnitrophica bacterium]|nr:cold shock domain-containing protein [Candidatus Omnitrophota bacterium]MCB9719940.1 cold shock domain-containing protein [Candidatus Omnitrophota bacterium]
MEKGTVKSYDKNCGMGMISRSSEVDVKFYADSIVGRDRVSLTQGDLVWFEVDSIKNLHIAINIRKA